MMYLLKTKEDLQMCGNELSEMMCVAIDMSRHGYECDIINTTTGEVIMSLEEKKPPYISSCVHEIL